MKTFKFDKQHKYVIYGAGGNCYRLLEFFKQTDYSVVAIIDKRAESLVEVNNVPVYTLEDFHCNDKNNIIVMISIKNVFEHTNVACQLLKRGYSNLIYKPEPTLKGIKDDIWDSINTAYDCLIEGNYLQYRNGLEVAVSDSSHMREYTNRLLIETKEDRVLTWLPMELIFNYDREELFGRQHMMAFYPLVNLYKYLLGNLHIYSWKEIRDDYLLYSADWVYKKGLNYDTGLRNSLIESRINVFREMQRNAEIDQQFFVRNAVEVALCEGFGFCMTSSGRNRVAFLLAKGYHYIPVVMSKKDYEEWYNAECYKNIMDKIQKLQIEELFSTIPHPILREVPVSVGDYERLWCMPVLSDVFRYLHWKSLQNDCEYSKVERTRFLEYKKDTKVGILSSDDGKISRCFAMAGFPSYRVYVNGISKGIEKEVDKLVRSNENVFLKEGELEVLEECNILILESRYNDVASKYFKGERIYILDSEEKFEVQCWERYGYKCTGHIFSSVWKGVPVSGYLLVKD